MSEEENDIEEHSDIEEENKNKHNISLSFQCELNSKFTGVLISLTEHLAEVKFKPTEDMVIDEQGLVHSSFIMSACEYAAIAVINKENLYVQNVEAEYLAPLEIGNVCIIKSIVKYQGDKKKIVLVQAFDKHIKIFDGTFHLLELEQHILDIKLNEQVE